MKIFVIKKSVKFPLRKKRGKILQNVSIEKNIYIKFFIRKKKWFYYFVKIEGKSCKIFLKNKKFCKLKKKNVEKHL